MRSSPPIGEPRALVFFRVRVAISILDGPIRPGPGGS
jgi:hypothetical protein